MGELDGFMRRIKKVDQFGEHGISNMKTLVISNTRTLVISCCSLCF